MGAAQIVVILTSHNLDFQVGASISYSMTALKLKIVREKVPDLKVMVS